MSTDNDKYIPIACGLHSQYELAIIQCSCHQISWKDEHNINHCANGYASALFIKDKQEFLTVRLVDDTTHTIRLDKILHFDIARSSSN